MILTQGSYMLTAVHIFKVYQK